MEVMGVNPLHRLVLPRLLAATLVAILLDAVVSEAGIFGFIAAMVACYKGSIARAARKVWATR
jgi:phospholipid/cholesterol/gamma-HCH transport system permease protein